LLIIAYHIEHISYEITAVIIRFIGSELRPNYNRIRSELKANYIPSKLYLILKNH